MIDEEDDDWVIDFILFLLLPFIFQDIFCAQCDTIFLLSSGSMSSTIIINIYLWSVLLNIPAVLKGHERERKESEAKFN